MSETEVFNEVLNFEKKGLIPRLNSLRRMGPPFKAEADKYSKTCHVHLTPGQHEKLVVSWKKSGGYDSLGSYVRKTLDPIIRERNSEV